jgi:hypothetical protein
MVPIQRRIAQGMHAPFGLAVLYAADACRRGDGFVRGYGADFFTAFGLYEVFSPILPQDWSNAKRRMVAGLTVTAAGAIAETMQYFHVCLGSTRRSTPGIMLPTQERASSRPGSMIWSWTG